MISQLVGAVINIILDPILIFGYFGLPEMGVAGAAIATIAGQIIAAGVGVTLNVKCNHEISLSLKGFRPSGKIIGRILAVGVPSIILASIGSVMVFIMNKILGAFTSTAAAVFGVYFKLQSLCIYARFRIEQCDSTYNSVQLRSRKPQTHNPHGKTGGVRRGRHNAYRSSGASADAGDRSGMV